MRIRSSSRHARGRRRETDRDMGGEVYHDVMPGHRAAERFRVEETRCDGERASSAQQFAASPRAQPAHDRPSPAAPWMCCRGKLFGM